MRSDIPLSSLPFGNAEQFSFPKLLIFFAQKSDSAFAQALPAVGHNRQGDFFMRVKM